MEDNIATCQPMQNLERTIRHTNENLEAHRKEIETALSGNPQNGLNCCIKPNEPIKMKDLQDQMETCKRLIDECFTLASRHVDAHPNMRSQPARGPVDSALGRSVTSVAADLVFPVQETQGRGVCRSVEVLKASRVNQSQRGRARSAPGGCALAAFSRCSSCPCGPNAQADETVPKTVYQDSESSLTETEEVPVDQVQLRSSSKSSATALSELSEETTDSVFSDTTAELQTSPLTKEAKGEANILDDKPR